MEEFKSLSETFEQYLIAESAATSAYLEYKFGYCTEREVHRLQGLEQTAKQVHLNAIAAVQNRAKNNH